MSTDRLKYILLSIFLIIQGLILVGLVNNVSPWTVIAGVSAIISGILFLIYR